MHQLSKRLKNVPNALIVAYRASEVKHACLASTEMGHVGENF
jgi:hypothetical protein